MSRRVTVHHFVANLTTRQYGPHPTSDLLGVDYIHDVPADTEFPRWLPRVDLFTRFYLRNAKPTEYLIRVVWRSAPEALRPCRHRYGPFTIPFQSTDVVHDHAFRLVNVRLDGVGWYDAVLYRRRRSSFGRRWQRLVETHWLVER
jgi:hypothetical protein